MRPLRLCAARAGAALMMVAGAAAAGAVAMAMAVAATPAWAGPGHDHGDAPAAATGTASPRFSAHSDLFELTGIVKDKTIILYLDEFASNAPVVRATIELELQGRSGAALKLLAVPAEEGTFAIALTSPLAEGSFAVTATVRAAADGKPLEDLLSGSLDIHAGSRHAPETGSHQWLWRYGGLGAALAAILGVVTWIRLRAMRLRRRGALT